MMKKISLLTIYLLITSCTSVEESRTEPNTRIFDLSYAYYSYNMEEINYFSREHPELIFRAIPGRIFGNPSPEIFSLVTPDSDKEFRLQLPQQPTETADYLRVPGLEISPGTPKVLRLGTFHRFPNDADVLGGGGFINQENGNLIILIYASEAAQIYGTLNIGNERFTHQIELEKQGWHWVEVEEVTDGDYVLKRYEGDESNIAFTILLERVYGV